MALISGGSATFDSTVSSGSVESEEIYDLRQGGDEGSASTYMNGATILSSAASSTPTRSVEDERSNRGMITVPISSSLSLSLNPAMVNSSVLLPSDTDANGNWIDFNEVAPSQSSMSSNDSTASGSTSCSPDVLINIGRSMMLASQSSHTAVTGSETATKTLSAPSRVAEFGKGIFENLQTDEEWDNFRAKAKEYLNALVAEEMNRLKQNEDVGRNCSDVDKSQVTKDGSQQSSQGLWQWIHALYMTINAAISGHPSKNTSSKSHVYEALVKEIVEIKEQLKRLPPKPPTLSLDCLALDELPDEKRDELVQYETVLNTWRGEIKPQYEELEGKYFLAQEKLLAAIIDTEEELFYEKKEGELFGEVNKDGYVEVFEQHHPRWDDVEETVVVSQSKCNFTTLGQILAALTMGAGFLLSLQSKKR